MIKQAVRTALYAGFTETFNPTFRNKRHLAILPLECPSSIHANEHNRTVLEAYGINFIFADRNVQAALIDSHWDSILYIPSQLVLREDFVMRSIQNFLDLKRRSSVPVGIDAHLYTTPVRISKDAETVKEHPSILNGAPYPLEAIHTHPIHLISCTDSGLDLALSVSKDSIHKAFLNLLYSSKILCKTTISTIPTANFTADYVFWTNHVKSCIAEHNDCAPISLGANGFLSSTNTLPARRQTSLDEQKTSVIIPFHEKLDMTYSCVMRLRQLHPDIKIIAIAHKTKDSELLSGTIDLCDHTIRYDGPYNYSLQCNLGLELSEDAYPGNDILLLNNDVILTENTLPYLWSWKDRARVGVVGTILLYPDSKHLDSNSQPSPESLIQHAGVLRHHDKPDTEPHKYYHYCCNMNYGEYLYMNRRLTFPSTTAACALVMSSHIPMKIRFDELMVPSSHSDTHLFGWIRANGYHIIVDPRSIAFHHESASRETVIHDDIESLAGERFHGIY